MADTANIDYTEARKKFLVEDDGIVGGFANDERDIGCCTKVWQSRFSGWPVAIIFGLYVYYLLVFVVLETTVNAQLKKQVDQSDINVSVISQIKYERIQVRCFVHHHISKVIFQGGH